MPAIVSWYIEKRVMYVKFIGDISFDEIGKANDEQVALLEEGTAPIHQITNFSEAGDVPITLKEATDKTSFFEHAKLGWVTNFGEPNRKVKFVSNVISSTSDAKLRHFDSEEECIAFLRTKDSTL